MAKKLPHYIVFVPKDVTTWSPPSPYRECFDFTLSSADVEGEGLTRGVQVEGGWDDWTAAAVSSYDGAIVLDATVGRATFQAVEGFLSKGKRVYVQVKEGDEVEPFLFRVASVEKLGDGKSWKTYGQVSFEKER